MSEPNETLSRPQFDGSRLLEPGFIYRMGIAQHLEVYKIQMEHAEWWRRRRYPSNQTEVRKPRGFWKLFRSYFSGLQKYFPIFSSTPPYQCIDPASTWRNNNASSTTIVVYVDRSLHSCGSNGRRQHHHRPSVGGPGRRPLGSLDLYAIDRHRARSPNCHR